MPKRSVSQLSLVLLCAAVLALPCAHATPPDEPAPASPAGHAAPPEPLDMRLPPTVARPTVAAAADDGTAVQRRAKQAIRLEPRQSFIEWGVQGSREALIACQKGPYPGATVASSGVPVAGGEAQPDHCYRF